MHAQLDAVWHALGDPQQLDAVTQLLGILDVCGTELGDALDISLVKLHRNTKGDGRHESGLVGCVHAFDVKGGVGFGITQRLSFLEHHTKIQALVAHFAQNEIGGAVDDAGNPLDAVGCEAFTQRFDDRNATGHCGFKRHHHTFGGSRREDLGAMHREQRLVGGHHMFARRNGFHHQGFGNAVAANQLNDDVDVWVGNDGTCVTDHRHVRPNQLLGTRHVQVGHHGDFNATACAALDFLLIALEHIESARAHHTDAKKANLNRFHHVYK